MKKYASILLIAAIAACGGGSDGGDVIDFSGKWNGTANLVSDTCNAAPASRLLMTADESLNFEHQVAQNGSAIQLTDSAAVQYLGNIVGEDGFSVDGVTQSGNDESGASCEVAGRIRYTEIGSSTDNTADVGLTLTETCDDGFTCEIVYTGNALREEAAPETDPEPEPEPEEEFTSCTQTQELTYTGDGGCNINSANVQISSNATDGQFVLIDPFGSNGATSFILSDTDPTTATAVSTDLTIEEMMEMNGEEMNNMNGDIDDIAAPMTDMNSGYSCSIKCESSLTFVLSCFQENGNSCEERF